MNPFRAIKSAVVAVAMFVLNFYEAGRRFTTERSTIPGRGPIDARFDCTSADRIEIVRKSQYFECNNGIVQRLIDLFEQFTVGCNGLNVIPASEDEEWNQRASEVFAEWMPFADLTSRQGFGTLQSLIARKWFVDGEIFILKTRGATDKGSRPRIQLIETHRVATPPDLYGNEGQTVIDGVEIDPTGRPIAYWVRDGFDDDVFRRIDANSIIHVFEPSRPGQYRGLPMVSAVLNDLHDLDDLQLLEMKAAKDAADITNVINTESGEMDAQQMRKNRFNLSGQTTTGDTVSTATVKRDQYLRSSLGGRTVALRLGEKLEQFRSERPSVAVQTYWDYITWKICVGVGISKLLVFPWSIQGTVVRADLDLANAFFRARSSVIAAAVAEVWRYVMDYAIRADVRVADAPSDWRKVNIRPPRAVNVDVGRNSDAKLAELEAGVTTFETLFAEDGEDWRVQLRQKAKEAAYILKLAAEFKIDPSMISTKQLEKPQRPPAPVEEDLVPQAA